jgi:hypothetical protein
MLVHIVVDLPRIAGDCFYVLGLIHGPSRYELLKLLVLVEALDCFLFYCLRRKNFDLKYAYVCVNVVCLVLFELVLLHPLDSNYKYFENYSYFVSYHLLWIFFCLRILSNGYFLFFSYLESYELLLLGSYGSFIYFV